MLFVRSKFDTKLRKWMERVPKICDTAGQKYSISPIKDRVIEWLCNEWPKAVPYNQFNNPYV